MHLDHPQHNQRLDRLDEPQGRGFALCVEERCGCATDAVQTDVGEPDHGIRPQGATQEIARVDAARPEQLRDEARLRPRESHGVTPEGLAVDDLVFVLDPVAAQHARHERLQVRQVGDGREVGDARVVQIGVVRQIARPDDQRCGSEYAKPLEDLPGH